MIEIKDIIRHPIQLHDIELVELNLKKNEDLLSEEIVSQGGDIQVKSWSQINGDFGFVYLKLKIEPKKGLFYIEVTYKGKCQAVGELAEGEFEHFLEIQSVKLLWPYVREIITDITLKMGVKPIHLPTLDVLQTMEQASQKQKDSADQ